MFFTKKGSRNVLDGGLRPCLDVLLDVWQVIDHVVEVGQVFEGRQDLGVESLLQVCQHHRGADISPSQLRKRIRKIKEETKRKE